MRRESRRAACPGSTRAPLSFKSRARVRRVPAAPAPCPNTRPVSDRHQQGEGERAGIELDALEQRNAERIQVRDSPRAGHGQHQAQRGAAAGEHDALGQHLPDQAPRPAPSAARIAISFCRAAVRASSRFERFAHTISITTPTAQASTKRAGRRRRSRARRAGLTCRRSVAVGITSLNLRRRGSRSSACACCASRRASGARPSPRVSPAVRLRR